MHMSVLEIILGLCLLVALVAGWIAATEVESLRWENYRLQKGLTND